MDDTKFHGLNHLRSLAVILVFLFHYQLGIYSHPDWVTTIGSFGWTGVDLFFVLSGFLIASGLFTQIKAHNRIDFKAYFIKRTFRILPAYWAVLAIYCCIPFFHERESMLPLWRYLTFTQNLGLNILTSGTFSHAWSLCAEEHFYLVLPVALAAFLASGLFEKAFWLPLALFLLTLFLRSYFWNHDYLPNIHSDNAAMLWYKYVYYPTYCRADGLLVGIAAAATFHFAPKSWATITRYGNAAFAAALLVLSAAYVLCVNPLSYPASVFGFSIVALGYGLLLISAMSPGCFLFKWQSKYTGYLAALSYAVYLTHKGIIHITQSVGSNFGIDPEGSAMFILCILACLTGAAILYLAIERPFMALRNRILRN